MAYSGLKDLLRNPNAYRIGTTGQNAASKGIKFLPPDEGGPLLGDRVTWDITDDNAEPTFGKFGVIGRDHGTLSSIDSFVRGGPSTALDRRLVDAARIGKFLLTPNGIQFLATQATLQALNPRPQKFYNLGINTIASIASAGVLNIRRGGLLPSEEDFNILGKAQTYIGEVGESERKQLREQKYGLGDPGKLESKKLLQSIKDLNPLNPNKGLAYDVSTGVVDKVNALKIFKSSDSIPNAFEEESKDFVPFRFEVINQDKPGDNNIIVFRAYLDTVSDDYNATYNTFKYNGRGEEFYTYQKFGRKIAISFKVAAQSRFEMQPIYQKLNYLAAQTAPNYSSTGRIRTPYCKLTVGNWFNRIPGLITQVGLQWQKDYPWEIALDKDIKRDENGNVTAIEGKDKDMLILPHVLDVSFSFQPIHKFTPSNDIMSPFIGIDGDSSFPDWREEPLTKTETSTQ
tara:strand:+ start:196 stop:1566 length:1371 start_codon:yes stop_codon:yes gene_type:complete